MICEECKRRNFKKILAEADKAMKRYTAKLRKELHGKQKQSKGE